MNSILKVFSGIFVLLGLMEGFIGSYIVSLGLQSIASNIMVIIGGLIIFSLGIGSMIFNIQGLRGKKKLLPGVIIGAFSLIIILGICLIGIQNMNFS